MNNLIKLLGVVSYCIFVTHYVGKIYPSLSFYYYILEFGLLIHLYKVITNNKSNIDDYMGVTYLYTLCPQLKDVEKKSQVLIKGFVYALFVFIIICPVIVIATCILLKKNHYVLYFLLIAPIAIAGVVALAIQIKEWINIGNSKRIKK